MLAISETTMKSIAENTDFEDSPTKVYQVDQGTVFVASKAILVAVTTFDPRESGFYEFGSNDKSSGQYDLSSYLALRKKCQRLQTFDLYTIKSMFNILSAWAKNDTNREDPALVQFSVTGNEAKQSRSIQLKGEGIQNRLPYLSWLMDSDLFCDYPFHCLMEVKELVKMLTPFSKLAEGSTPTNIMLSYTESFAEEPTDDPFFFTCAYNGHSIATGANCWEPRENPKIIREKETPPLLQAIEDAENQDAQDIISEAEGRIAEAMDLDAGAVTITMSDSEPDEPPTLEQLENSGHIVNLFPEGGFIKPKRNKKPKTQKDVEQEPDGVA